MNPSELQVGAYYAVKTSDGPEAQQLGGIILVQSLNPFAVVAMTNNQNQYYALAENRQIVLHSLENAIVWFTDAIADWYRPTYGEMTISESVPAGEIAPSSIIAIIDESGNPPQ